MSAAAGPGLEELILLETLLGLKKGNKYGVREERKVKDARGELGTDSGMCARNKRTLLAPVPLSLWRARRGAAPALSPPPPTPRPVTGSLSP